MRKCLFLIVNLITIELSAQGMIEGRVVDAETGSPLEGVNVFIENTFIGGVADAAGEYRIRNVPEGSVIVVFSMLGYDRLVIRDVEITEGVAEYLSVELYPAVIETSPVVVTATRTERSLLEVPTSVSLLYSDDIERKNIFTVDEILRSVSGIHFNQSQVNIRGSSGYSHGAGSRVLLLIDGVPLHSADTGEISWEMIPTTSIERIEVVKGSGSTLYGSKALGGVINIITKDLPEKPVTSIRFQGGLYDKPAPAEWHWTDKNLYKSSVDLSHGRRIGRLRISGSFGFQHDDSYRKSDESTWYSGFINSGYTLTSEQSILVNGYFIRQERDNFLYWRDLNSALEPPEHMIGERVESFRFLTNLVYRYVINPVLYFTARGSWYHTDWRDNIGNGGNRSRADVTGGEMQLHFTPSKLHFITAGIESGHHSVYSDIFGNRNGLLLAGFFQHEYSPFEPLKLTSGVRVDMTRLDTVDTYINISPRAGIVYRIDENTILLASGGSGFRAPTAAEAFTSTIVSGLYIRPNPSVQPERSWSFELGANTGLRDWLGLNLALFQNEYWDLIEPVVTDIDPDEGIINAEFRNVGRARVRGFELNVVSSFFTRKINPSIGYTYVDGEDLSTGLPLKYRHRHMLQSQIIFRYRSVQLDLDYRYLSRIEEFDREIGIVVEDADQFVPIHRFDLSIVNNFDSFIVPVRVGLSVRNLLRYHYVEFIGNVAPIRHFILSVQMEI